MPSMYKALGGLDKITVYAEQKRLHGGEVVVKRQKDAQQLWGGGHGFRVPKKGISYAGMVRGVSTYKFKTSFLDWLRS